MYAVDKTQSPGIIYLCECKYWEKNIPQDEVMTFRTKMNDYGANTGFIISKVGFQKGAFEVAENTNVILVNWDQFQDIFIDKWFKFMSRCLYDNYYPLLDYADPMNSYMSKKVQKLDKKNKKAFLNLQKNYHDLYMILAIFSSEIGLERVMSQDININFKNNKLCDLFKRVFEESSNAIKEFDDIFGEKIRFYGDKKYNQDSFDRLRTVLSIDQI